MKGNSGIFIFSKEGLGACYFWECGAEYGQDVSGSRIDR